MEFKESRHSIPPAGNIEGFEKGESKLGKGELFSFDGWLITSTLFGGYALWSWWTKKVFNVFWLMRLGRFGEPVISHQAKDPEGFKFSLAVFLILGVLFFLLFLQSYSELKQKSARQQAREQDASSQ